MFRAFVEAVASSCRSETAGRLDAAIRRCAAVLNPPGEQLPLDIPKEEQELYASALLVNLLQRQQAGRYRELLTRAKTHAKAAFQGAGIGRIQNYISANKKTKNPPFYPRVFAVFAAAFDNEAAPPRVAILGSGALNYVTEIRDGFVNRVRSVYQGWRPVVDHSGPVPAEIESASWQPSINAIRTAEEHTPIDYLVGIGTQASMVLQRYAAERQRPLLFLGVTDPIAAGLVRDLAPPHDRPASGVAYCDGADTLVRFVRNSFPGRPVAFVYRRDVPQDEALAAVMSRKFKNVVRVIATSDYPRIDDLHDPNAVYFSWYTFDYMFEHAHPNARPILASRIVVTTTLANTEVNARALVAIGADDIEIGRLGAEMLLRVRAEGGTLSDQRVEVAPLRARFNRVAIQQRGLVFDESAGCIR